MIHPPHLLCPSRVLWGGDIESHFVPSTVTFRSFHRHTYLPPRRRIPAMVVFGPPLRIRTKKDPERLVLNWFSSSKLTCQIGSHLKKVFLLGIAELIPV
jgi:hypothetical protein